MKEIKIKVIVYLILCCFFSYACNDSKHIHLNNEGISQERDYIKFNQDIEDTLSRYISNISDSCDILIWLDRSYIYNTYRINVRSVSKKYFSPHNLFFTKINGYKIFINTSLEELMTSYQQPNSVECDGTMFVVYDSMRILTVIKNLNSFDDDFRPSQQLKITEKLRYRK